MDSLQLEAHFTMDDVFDFNRHLMDEQRGFKRRVWAIRYFSGPLMLFSGSIFSILIFVSKRDHTGLYYLIGPLLLISGFYLTFFAKSFLRRLVFMRVKNAAKRNAFEKFLEPTRLTIGPDGLRTENRFMNTIYHWNAIVKFHELETVLYVYIGPASAVIIPKRCFKSEQDWGQWKAALKERVDAANN